MLNELFERWRGIDHWPQTEATVVSYELLLKYTDPYAARIGFYYHDQTGAIQSGVLTANSRTSLYNLKVNDTFALVFNP